MVLKRKSVESISTHCLSSDQDLHFIPSDANFEFVSLNVHIPLSGG